MFGMFVNIIIVMRLIICNRGVITMAQGTFFVIVTERELCTGNCRTNSVYLFEFKFGKIAVNGRFKKAYRFYR